jgi:hypothetical protein
MTNTHSKIITPPWVKWVAQDADGCWWGFEVEPNRSYSGWYENEIGRFIRLYQEQADSNWQSTLREL